MSFPYTRIVVGSSNPVKLAAVRAVLTRVAELSSGATYDIHALEVDSGVPAQPIGDEETQRGARNRACAALQATDAELAVGLEGGVIALGEGRMRTCAWAVVVDRAGREGMGGSLSMPLPRAVAERIDAGEELGYAMDAVAQAVGTKHGRGAVGILTAEDTHMVAETAQVAKAVSLAPWLAPAFFD